MKLAIFSDIHYCPDISQGFHNGFQRKLVEHSLPIMNKLINEINTNNFDAAICLGDYIQDVFDRGQDIVNLTYINKLLDDIKTPLYKVPGNHDLRTLTMEDIKKVFGYENLTYSKDIDGYHLIFLSVTADYGKSTDHGGIDRTQYLSNEDLKWLEDDLNTNELPAIIFTHFGVAEDSMQGNFWFNIHTENALLKNRKELKSIIEDDKNILGVFSGHQHWTKDINENGVQYHILGSLTENLNNDGIPDGVWLEVDIVGTDLNIIEHHIKI